MTYESGQGRTNPAYRLVSSAAPQSPDSLLHIIVGPLYAVNTCRHELHLRGYAQANDWSNPLKLIHTADILRGQHPNDVLRVLHRRAIPRA